MAQLPAGLAMLIDVRSNEGRNELIFSHEGNARVAASVILIGVVVALIGSLFMAIGPKFKQAPRQGGDASVGAASTSVRIVGQPPRDNVPCDQQVWPNFAHRCLVRTEATPNLDNPAPPAQTSEPSTPPAIPNTAQSSSQSASRERPVYYAPPTVRQRDSFNFADSSDTEKTAFSDDTDEVREPEFTEPPPRKRPRRHYKSFHFHFGAFRF